MTIKVNDKNIKTFVFSGGEVYVSLDGIEVGQGTTILAHLHSSEDVMQLLMTVDAVRQANAETEIHLIMPYLPYARQDRVCNDGEAFAAAVMCDLINSLNCASVQVLDLHSAVTRERLNNVREFTQADLIPQSEIEDLIERDHVCLVYPDKGAEARVRQVAQALATKGIDCEVIPCSKVRNPENGQITDSVVQGDVRGKNCIIIDDICDGGRTFIELAKVLKKQGAQKLYLSVSHGIFSKGLDVLKEHFERVYCFNSFLDEAETDTEFLTVIGKGERS